MSLRGRVPDATGPSSLAVLAANRCCTMLRHDLGLLEPRLSLDAATMVSTAAYIRHGYIKRSQFADHDRRPQAVPILRMPGPNRSGQRQPVFGQMQELWFIHRHHV